MGGQSRLGEGGGVAPLYRITPASLEKSGDGLAMGFRAGAEFIDMEMMQFHPTGLIAGDFRYTSVGPIMSVRTSGSRTLVNVTPAP